MDQKIKRRGFIGAAVGIMAAMVYGRTVAAEEARAPATLPSPRALVTDVISADPDAYHDDCRAVSNKWDMDLWEFFPPRTGHEREKRLLKNVRIFTPKDFHPTDFAEKLRLIADYYDSHPDWSPRT